MEFRPNQRVGIYDLTESRDREYRSNFRQRHRHFRRRSLKESRRLAPEGRQTLRPEDKPVPSALEDGFHVPYTWLTIMVTDEFNVNHRQGELKNKRKDILDELIPQLDGSRDRAFFIAAIFATFFRASLFELWIQQP